MSDISHNKSCNGSQLNEGDYIKILWTTTAGLLIFIILIDIIGRKGVIVMESVAALFGFLLLFICSSDIILTCFLFLIRISTSIVPLNIYTSKVYPTNARAFGIGIASSAACIGFFITPYFAQVLLYTSFEATISIYAGSCLVMAVLALMLPIETKGRPLHDTGKS